MNNATTHSGAEVLTALVICGLFGMVGQGIRAVLGLKTASATAAQHGLQSQFNAAYFALSMMIGFIAGMMAGIIVGLQNFITIDLGDLKPLLGLVASGYAGADFIENSLSFFMPGTKPPAPPPAQIG